ncbi:MAG: imidazole glycerol phosphate synthase, glutamine amidotransferase subunit [Chloroflexi bacterium RBG_16_60_22]|nr:MAG: imidazole glycerol phosphate synthase, glutamine amidotransferase subunit [Chloroflexi bacterium RBG_16_60_22]
MITIIDYNAGNIRSVQRACAEVGIEAVTTASPADVLRADRLIFPGVGAAPSAMDYLKKTGLDAALVGAFNAGTPVLGICLGAQIVLESSEEGPQKCLGLLPGKTVRFRLKDPRLKIPHMGWNGVRAVRPHPLLDGIQEGDEFYFVHSFYPRPAREDNVYAVTDYGGDFCSALGYKNLFAAQFHPEKSGRLGLQLLERFTRWDGSVATG